MHVQRIQCAIGASFCTTINIGSTSLFRKSYRARDVIDSPGKWYGLLREIDYIGSSRRSGVWSHDVAWDMGDKTKSHGMWTDEKGSTILAGLFLYRRREQPHVGSLMINQGQMS